MIHDNENISNEIKVFPLAFLRNVSPFLLRHILRRRPMNTSLKHSYLAPTREQPLLCAARVLLPAVTLIVFSASILAKGKNFVEKRRENNGPLVVLRTLLGGRLIRTGYMACQVSTQQRSREAVEHALRQ